MFDKSDGIIPLEPTKSSGPIFFDGDMWYRNGDFTGEFMIDTDLSLINCRRIVFVDHNSRYCKKYGSGCPQKDYSKYHGGCIVMAKLIGCDMRSARRLFVDKKNNKSILTAETKSILSKLIQDLVGDFEDKTILVKGKRKKIVFKSALMLVGENKYHDAMEMLDLLGAKKSVMRCWLTILTDFFRISRIDLSRQLHLGKFA
jgi:hypothetical protein